MLDACQGRDGCPSLGACRIQDAGRRWSSRASLDVLPSLAAFPSRDAFLRRPLFLIRSACPIRDFRAHFRWNHSPAQGETGRDSREWDARGHS